MPVRSIALLALLALSNLAAAADDRPNILFIAIDDLNDWVEPLGGHPLAHTPNMAALAARGTTFTNAHCQAPLCNPSRTSLLTGLRPSTTGVYALNSWIRSDPEFRDVVTLPQYLMKHGYYTATTGKIFHGAYPPRKQRVDGNEFSEWGPAGGIKNRPKEPFVHTPANHPLMDWGPFPKRDEACFDYDNTTWGVEFLARAPADQPWMLCVGLRHPHVPCYAPQKWFDLYPDDKSILPPVKQNDRDDIPRFAWYLHWKLPEPRLVWLQKANQWQPLVRAYLASVSYADAMVGRLLKQLEATGHVDDTVVVLWSDHGWHLGEKGISGKNTLWQESTRVPLIFAGPGIASGARCDEAVELLDIYPTLIDLCSLPKRKALEGHSLVPQLKNASTPRQWPAITTHGPNNHTVRTDDWRYIRYANGSEELYNLKTDPREWNNLAGDPRYKEKKAKLAATLPEESAPPLGKGTVRLLEEIDGVYYWEGEAIGADDPVPGVGE